MFSSWWSKGSTGSFSCELGQEIKLNGQILGAGAFGQLHSGTQNKTNNVSIFVSSESMISAGQFGYGIFLQRCVRTTKVWIS